jgi:cell division septal protein FtsQ
MPRKSLRRKPKKKRSKGKRNHAFEIARPSAQLASGPLVGLWQVRGGTMLSVLLLAALALLTSQFFTTDRFYVYGIEVQGNQFVSPDQIYDASGLHEWSIFWIKPDQVAATISSLLGLKEVRVTCRLPNRVRIEVVERQTQIIWQRGELRFSVDDRGIMLPLETELEGMLLIQDLTTGSLEVGDQIDSEAVRSALELRRLLPETAVLQYSEDKGLILHQADYPVYLGTGDMAEKVAILNALLRDFALEGIQPEFVDVRFIESPSYKAVDTGY